MDKNNSKLLEKIDKATKIFTEDNISLPTKEDYIFVLNAMMIGSSIAFSFMLNEEAEYLKILNKTS